MLERKLFKTILITASLMSILSIGGNSLSGFDTALNLKWIVLFLVSALTYYVAEFKEKRTKVQLFYFVYLILIFLPFAFVDSGGSLNNAIGYVFLLLICIVYLFAGPTQRVLVGMLIVVFVGLHSLEYYYPQFIKQHAPQSQYIDRLIQIPLIMMACYLTIQTFAQAYKNQKMEQERYNQLLEEMNAMLESQAMHDELTKLNNRRAFNEALNRVQSAGLVRFRDVYVVIFDLDKFKQINDTLGHLAADDILKKFSDELKKCVSDNVILSRWGGDEFSMILYDMAGGLVDFLEEIQTMYAGVVKTYEVNSKVSFGASKWQENETIDHVLTRADQALYQAKESGRGRIVIFEK